MINFVHPSVLQDKNCWSYQSMITQVYGKDTVHGKLLMFTEHKENMAQS